MKHNFLHLKLKMLLWVIVCTMAAWLVGILVLELLLDGLLREPLARLFFWFTENWRGLSEAEAAQAYQSLVVDHKPLILAVLIALFMFIACYVAFGRFSRYLNQITDSVHQVFSGETEPVILPEELSPIQTDLNGIQKALLHRRTLMDSDAQRKSDLIAYLAHDLKTPLTSVLGYLDLLHTRPDLPLEQRIKYTGIALDKAQRLEKLITEFSDITQMELGTIVQEQEAVRLDLLLYQLAEEFYPLMTEKNLSLQMELGGRIDVTGSPERLARAFDNVLRNAVSYSNPGTTVGLNAATFSDHVEVVISNEGLQIPEGELTTIFQKFYRLDEARQTRTGGAGLGLAIAKEIVDLHGGTIRAAVTGRRTIFTIQLPLRQED